MSDTISFSDFQKLDIRVGAVIEAVVPEWSHWVMKLKLDPLFRSKPAPKSGKRFSFLHQQKS